MAQLMDSVVGHDRVKSVLRETLSRDSVPPSFIFAGPAGVGKFRLGVAWAQWLLCQQSEREACGVCADCVQVENLSHSNLLVIEPEKTSIKLEQTRELMRKLSLQQWKGRRVVIFNEAQLLNPHAANSLLKVVEEPPEGTHFVFVTSSYFSMLSTLRSRSQRIQFQPLSEAELGQISGQSGWVLGASQGRMDLLEKLSAEGMVEARGQAVSMLPMLLRGEHWQTVADQLKSISKDREQLSFAFGIWRQLLRDSFLENSARKIHQDFQGESHLEQLPTDLRLEMYDLFQAKEQALLGNADPSLTLESALIDVRLLQEAQGAV
ncbi:MAG: DNA polymerase III subunit [Pseudomonadota bacterium]